MEKNNKAIWTKRFISLFFTNITIFLTFYGLVTTLPLFAINELSRSDEEAGLLLSIFLVSAIIVRPFTGKLLDLFDKKKMLLTSLVIYTVCTILYIFIEPFGLLLVLRFFQGIWFSIATTATGSIAADIVPPERRGAGLGYFVMSTNLSIVLGPLVGLFVVQHFSYDLLFLTLSISLIIGSLAALSIKLMPEEQYKPAERNFKFTLNDLFERKSMPVALVACITSFSYASVLSFVSIYAEQKGLIEIATFFFAVYAAAMILSRPFTGRIFDMKGPSYIIIPGFILFGGGLLLMSFINNPFMFLLSGVLIGLGYGALVPSLQTKAVQDAGPHRSGYGTATFFTLFDLGMAIGSYVLGMIAANFGYENLYFTAALVVIVALLFYLIVARRSAGQLKNNG
ncbi:MFS transporter [Chungangia koreensis]|uniref:MFS transporter n=1 Tax=Chungangia koreensis TaxID=752657 RepID=A0ABV8X7D6_9LACT